MVKGRGVVLAGSGELTMGQVLPPTNEGYQQFLRRLEHSKLSAAEARKVLAYWWSKTLSNTLWAKHRGSQ